MKLNSVKFNKTRQVNLIKKIKMEEGERLTRCCNRNTIAHRTASTTTATSSRNNSSNNHNFSRKNRTTRLNTLGLNLWILTSLIVILHLNSCCINAGMCNFKTHQCVFVLE